MTQPDIPALTKADRSFHSVERFPRFLIADIVLLRTAFDTRSMNTVLLFYFDTFRI